MRAIGKVLRWIWHGLDGLRKILHFLLLLLIFGVIGTLFSRPIPLVPDQAALVIAPQGPIVEQYTGDPVERAVADTLRQGPEETLLRDLVEAIRTARDDKRISSLYLDLGGLEGGGVAKLQEVAAAIDYFRKSGKPVIAFGEYYDQPQYYLAAHADEIYLDPQGIAYVDGFANYGMFIKDALEKLSIDWNVFRVGQYKSAVEMFTRNDMSPAEREESLRLAQLDLAHVESRCRQGAWHEARAPSRPMRTMLRMRCVAPMAISRAWRSMPGSSRRSRAATRSRNASRKSRARTRMNTRTRASITGLT